ncbi:ORF6N domain-containing protein, partial [Odoribacter splanchnicus]
MQSKIYEIRGQRVMLDRDLAELYGIETKRLK